MTTDSGSWNGAPPFNYGWQWQDCDSTGSNCTPIAGATGSSYQLAQSDVGKSIQVVVTATNPAGSKTATSAQTAVVVHPVWTGFNESDWESFLTPTQLVHADQDRGATVDRTAINWDSEQPSSGSWCDSTVPGCGTAALDGYYQTVTGQQPNAPYNPNVTPAIRPVIAILGPIPNWAYDGGSQTSPQVEECVAEDAAYANAGQGPTCSGWNEQAYADFAASVAKRYPYAAAIEVWNEENSSKAPRAGNCDPNGNTDWCWGVQAYAEALQDTYQTVHPLTQNGTVAPDMKVLFGSLGGQTTTGGGVTASGEWLADVYSAWKGHAYMDGIGNHPYPEEEGDDGQDLSMDEIRDVRDHFHDSTRPIYVTETGISSGNPGSPDPNTTPSPNGKVPVDEAEQALQVAHIWNDLSPQPDIAAVLFHTIIDGGGQPDDGGEGLLDNNGGVAAPGVTGTGWFNTPYRLKPAFCVNAQLHASTGDGYTCPASVSVPSLTAEPTSGNFQAQTDLQAAYEVAREYFHQNGTYARITNGYLNSRNSTLLSASAPPTTNNPGSTADPMQIDIVTANANTLQICNSGRGDTSYCISPTPSSQVTYTTPSGTIVTATLPTYDEARNPTSGDQTPLSTSGVAGWAPPTGY